MTITNRELFVRDPIKNKIPNDGVAVVGRPESSQQWDVLRWELSSFVCEGQYAIGLERILDSFLKNLSQAQQPAAWVSGFYGSGKSHLVRVLETVWRDVELPGGDRARDLVELTDEIATHLVELSGAGKRLGGLWSVAGTLAAGKSDAVRLAFLSVLLEGAALPLEYGRARFTLWAQRKGYLAGIEAAIRAQGRTFEEEVHDLFVSEVIAESLLEQAPALWESPAEVLTSLRTQFPPTAHDITDSDMFEVIDDVLRLQSTSEDKLPLTLVVLDEMQQYINADNDKARDVQLLVEGCRDRYQSQLLIVATGQDDLGAHPTLQKLIDRFPVKVPLSSNDVDSVVRRVVLRKRPEHIPALKSALDAVSGEIDKHLAGTHLAPKAADKPDLVADYPVLPTRRRFWALALRGIDRAGKTGVLRTQLRTVHEAAAHVGGEPIGHVVGGDFLYFDQAAPMRQSQVLLRSIDEFIASLRVAGPDGELKARICALVFLISQTPSREMGTETGLRATPAFISDLLVQDLANEGATVRKRVPDLLDQLVTDGRLMRVDDEYQLQTEEGQAWEKDYQGRRVAIRDDAALISQLRLEQLTASVESALGGMKLMHGISKTPRRIHVHWGDEEPSTAEGDVPVWIRDEWSAAESSVKDAAAQAGDESAIVFVLLPKHEADQIKEALASWAAARETLSRPTPQTEEGKTAQRAMKTRMTSDEERISSLFLEVVSRARVFQGGGVELTTSGLRSAVETAATRSLIRLFPKFTAADNPNWGKVVTKARDGAPDALVAVGHNGEAMTNPVCKEVFDAIAATGTKGADLHKRFSVPGYGWPKDAVNGAVLALLFAGNIRAALEGSPVAGAKALPPTQIGKVTFYREDDPPSATQRIALRGLLQAAGISYESGQEGVQIPALLQHLKDLAAQAGGPPPLPEVPDTSHVETLLEGGGNQQFRAVADTHEQLRKELDLWREATRQRSKREASWHDLERLLRHAEGLDVAAKVAPGVSAIRDGRQLLDDPDPTGLLFDELAAELRKEVSGRAEQLAAAQNGAIAELQSWEDWGKLPPAQQESLLAETKLSPADPPDVSTDANLLELLDASPLASWDDRVSLVPGRRDQARQRAAKLLEPESVHVPLPSATVKTPGDLEAYLDEVRKHVQPHLDAKKTVII